MRQNIQVHYHNPESNNRIMSNGSLYIRDSRTSREYEIPIRRNTILATDLKNIKASAHGANRADKVADGLRVHDPGRQNTTVVETSMTYSYVHQMQGEALLYCQKVLLTYCHGTETVNGACYYFGDMRWSSYGMLISKTCCISLFGANYRLHHSESHYDAHWLQSCPPSLSMSRT